MNQKAVYNNHILSYAIKYWKYLAPVLAYPKNDREYEKLVESLDSLLDVVGNDEKHPLASLVDVLANHVSDYEEAHVKKPKSKGINAVKFLMQINDLNQSDFSAMASQGVMSELLNEKRTLNLKQIKWLATHFKLDPATFID